MIASPAAELQEHPSTSVRVIDEAPLLCEELAGYFRGLGLEELRRGWVGCMVDAKVTSDFAPADVARALIVVAERLHGVHFERPVMSQVPRAVSIPTVAGSMGESGFEVKSGPPPAPRRGSKHFDPLLAAMRALAPGQHIVVREDKYKPHQIISRVSKINAEGVAKLSQYSCAPGVRCVVREAK